MILPFLLPTEGVRASVEIPLKISRTSLRRRGLLTLASPSQGRVPQLRRRATASQTSGPPVAEIRTRFGAPPDHRQELIERSPDLAAVGGSDPA